MKSLKKNLVLKTMNSHLVVKETLEDKLACSYRKASFHDGKLLYFLRASDTNYIRALSRIKPAVYYEWSKAKKEYQEFFMMVSIRYSIGGDVEDILDIDSNEDEEYFLWVYENWIDRDMSSKNELRAPHRDKDDLAIPFLSIAYNNITFKKL